MTVYKMSRKRKGVQSFVYMDVQGPAARDQVRVD